jgi:phosphocarrier protein FPr
MNASNLLLKAPLSGVLVPIDQVPDPVFAQKMVGDGVSLDPTTARLLAPCDGRIIQLHSASHALTIASEQGIEVLIHIGLDTVNLKGQGFTARVELGDVVRAGDLLIDFDADYIATRAKSLLTQIVITNLDRVSSMTPSAGSVTAGTDTILDVALSSDGQPSRTPATDLIASAPIVVANPSGLHARPAALVASRAKQFASDIRLRRGGSEANARSVVAIMGLEIDRGDTVQFLATGPDARDAVEALSRLVTEGLGETLAADAPVPRQPASATSLSADDPNVLIGVAASPGIAVGNVFQVRHEQLRIVEDANDPRQERRALDDALEQAKSELDALQARLREEGAATKAAIFAAHRELLDDPGLLEIAGGAIGRGKSAAFGWQTAFTTHAERLAALKNELLAARANDLRDVGRRVLRNLTGVAVEAFEYPANTILIAEELTPSDTANLNRAQVLGFCTTTGGASSHVAILARSLDLPLVTGIDPRALDVPNLTPVILDGRRGTLRLNPSTADVARIHQQQERHSRQRRVEQEHAHEPAVTLDGHRVEVAANIGGLADAEQAVALGGEGVGLLRSEFLFLHRSTSPTEAEQAAVYADIARVLGHERRLVIRTLDVGGDKPLPYLPIPREDNPFLGERGIRVLLDHPDLLRAQLRAILRASTEGLVSIMFPMIATLDEWRAARAILEEERERLGTPRVEAGIMVEVASAALLADHFAKEVDFFSIGTNDLTQYTLAMDRGHPRLAPQVDGLSPAVLRLIANTVRAARAHGRWTGVCGGLAGDPQAVPLLVGFGVDELSVSVPAIPAIKAQIRRLRLDECRALAEAALDAETATDVRALVPLAYVGADLQRL